ncbi:hypothetical protein GO755_40115 [Spirosoma sp. HMF4905]|uniref:Lipoprotein n=1 Tax=Spirosoma arboris TaxID=2682092 RepID=A0A7K1SR54_9BACT|nr:hypothetical protein [Spirosoma arboris]MVM36282.1 hypothetical protein [Spirosoma arboris]
MRRLYWTLTSVLLYLLSACQNDLPIELADSDYLIFGHFYGECGGEACIEIFKLEQSRLLEDKNDQYPSASGFYKGDYVALTQTQFASVCDLIDSFPEALRKETKRVIGQPDAGDWGGLYIELTYKGSRQFWLIDQAKRNVPTEYHSFIDKVNEKIKLLQ